MYDENTKCKYCGESDQLYPDPAGYYIDATVPEGYDHEVAYLLCRWCHDPKSPEIIEAKKQKERDQFLKDSWGNLIQVRKFKTLDPKYFMSQDVLEVKINTACQQNLKSLGYTQWHIENQIIKTFTDFLKGN